MKIIQTSPGDQYNEEFVIETHFKDVYNFVDDRIELTDVDKNVINESYYSLAYDKLNKTIVIVNDSVESNISLERYDKIKRVIKDYKVKTRNDKINQILE